MKQLLILLLIVILFITGCKKNKYGNVKQQIRFTSEILGAGKKVKSQKSNQELRYTQFGDFVTSITPMSFVSELGPVRYFSQKGNEDFIALVGESTGIVILTADFAIDSTIPVIPTLCCNVYDNPDGQGGGYFKNDVTLKMLYIRMNLKPVFELPVEYSNVNLIHYQTQQNGRIITTNLYTLNQPVAELQVFNQTLDIYFGQFDSTYISSELPFPDYNSGVHLRSSNFTEWTLTPPLGVETKTIVSTLSFFIDNIIHVYAGADNIPYTEDDVIVLEPKFWERIDVVVTINEN